MPTGHPSRSWVRHRPCIRYQFYGGQPTGLADRRRCPVNPVYGDSTVKRKRRTNAELATLDELIIEVVKQDYPVSLRGVYYRVVSAGGVDKTEHAYRAVGRRLLELRRSGDIPYNRITDGTRWVVRPRSYDDLEDALTDTAELYRRNFWRNQAVEVHVFTEKDAITGVVERVTEQWNVPLGVLRGYCSETFAYTMAQAIIASGKPVFVYQLGDHDPSGVGAWQDFQRKIAKFAPYADMTFQRLAVTPAQIALYQLPTRPTKKSDTAPAAGSADPSRSTPSPRQPSGISSPTQSSSTSTPSSWLRSRCSSSPSGASCSSLPAGSGRYDRLRANPREAPRTGQEGSTRDQLLNSSMPEL